MRVMLMILLLFTMFTDFVGAETNNIVEKRALAIVIDDFGNDMKGTEEMLNSPKEGNKSNVP
jgi:polysaccharide deacetylase 2 family uncharacterized protein YibQ